MKARTVTLWLVVLAVTAGTSFASSQAEKPAAAEPAKPVTISLYTRQTYHTSREKDYINWFERDNPGIKVNAIIGSNNNEEYLQKLTISLASREQIDIYHAANPIYYLTFVEKKAAQPLDDFAARDKVVFDQPSVVEALRSLAADRKLYGYPGGSTFWLSYYNKDLFDAAGVAYPRGDWTYADYRAMAKKLTKGEGTDKLWGTYMHTAWEMFWYGPALQAGIQWYKDGGKRANLVGNKLLYEGIAMVRDMAAVDKSMTGHADNLASKRHYRAFFETGKVGMIYIGDWSIGFFREDQGKKLFDFKWDVAPMPVPEGSTPAATWGNPGTSMISSISKSPQAAWQYLKFINSNRDCLKLSAKTQLPSKNDPELIGIYFSEQPNLGPVPTRAREVLFNPKAVIRFEKVAGPKAAEYQRILAEEGGLALTGTKSPEQAMTDAEKRINDILAQ